MMASRERILADAEATGFRPEMLEKAIHLVNVLDDLAGHPTLKNRWALKGGTALNLFVFTGLPRLSVDIDVNYIGVPDRDGMLRERPAVEQAVAAVCSRLGLSVARIPGDHAGGKWRLRYVSAVAEGGNLELDLNFMLRTPLWPVTFRDSHPIGSHRAHGIPTLDVHELAAGKLAALLARHSSRDVFDAHRLLTTQAFDPYRLRVAFVVYGGMNRKDWRTVRVEDVAFDRREMEEALIPLLSASAVQALGGRAADWAHRLVAETRTALGAVLPLRENEQQFLDHLLTAGEVQPELLTDDPQLAAQIAVHPALAWKVLNVRQYVRKPTR